MLSALSALSFIQWAVLALAAALAGLTKAGLDGGTLLVIPPLAALFGARSSSALLLGLLIVSDLSALWNYRTQGSARHLARTLPFALVGIALGALVGKSIPERAFKTMLGLFILASAALMAIRESRGGHFALPERTLIAAPLGVLAGFASMAGNAAGPIMSLFLISSGLAKNRIIGTAVWFFFIVNLAKLPFHIFVWKTFTAAGLLVDLVLAPIAVAAGFLGVRLVRAIPERPYRIFRIIVSAAGGAYLLLF